jgi:hypothetical protein
LLWDFKDGTSKNMRDGKHHSHEYILRGHYNIIVKIKDGHTSVTKILPIKIGAVDFKLDKYVGYVANSKFKYTISGIGISGFNNVKIQYLCEISVLCNDLGSIFFDIVHVRVFVNVNIGHIMLNYDTIRNQTVVESYNECFTVNGIFDRQYSNKSHPMMVYTSSDFDLASRMAVYCNNVQIEFNWEIYTFWLPNPSFT